MAFNISPAHEADFETIKALLEREHLPVDGLHEHLAHTLVARDGNRIIGCGSVELYQDGALLRSIAVDAEHRGTGVGSELTRRGMDIAKRSGVPAVYLLTTTAERFFPRFGFEIVDRADVPRGVQSSHEFVTGCCSSGIVMRKFLTPTT
jgi:amino-acid N-acetyltransferase